MQILDPIDIFRVMDTLCQEKPTMKLCEGEESREIDNWYNNPTQLTEIL
jgi:hypothetical protein